MRLAIPRPPQSSPRPLRALPLRPTSLSPLPFPAHTASSQLRSPDSAAPESPYYPPSAAPHVCSAAHRPPLPPPRSLPHAACHADVAAPAISDIASASTSNRSAAPLHSWPPNRSQSAAMASRPVL